MISCIQCGQANLESKAVQLPGVIRGEDYTVEMQGLVCPRCGYKTVEGPAMPEYGRLLGDKYRAQHGLLTSEEIRARRARLGMTQEKFAEHLGVGLASVKRWEMGKIQDADSNRRILEKTETRAYSIMAWNTPYAPIVGSTLRGSFAVIDFTGLYYRPSRYSDQTVDPRGRWISVDSEDNFIHARYRTANPIEGRRSELCPLGQVH